MGLEQRSDEIAVKSVCPCKCDKPIVLPVCKAAARSDPERAVGVHKKRANEIIRQPICGGVGLDFCAFQMVQAIGRADPNAIVGSRRQSEDDVAEEAVAGGKMQSFSGLPAIHTVAVGSDPHGAAGCLRDGGNHMIGESWHSAEVLLPQDVKAAGLRADPEITFSVLKDGQDAAGAKGKLQLRPAAALVQHEKTLVGANPEIAA